MTKTNNWQTKRCISEVYFAYNTKSEGYPQSTADINKLSEILETVLKGVYYA